MSARFIIGDSLSVVRSMPAQSVHCMITSPAYFMQRDYLESTDPSKPQEMGNEETPGQYLKELLEFMDALWPVLRDDATGWINLGDKHAGSGGSGGDYNEGGMRAGQNKVRAWSSVKSAARRLGEPLPLDKAVCWLPALFGASMAYGRNMLTGEPCQQWITRPPITWCKTNPAVGEVTDSCRTATELIIFVAKQKNYYFDIDAIREEAPPENERKTWNQVGPKQKLAQAAGKAVAGRQRFTKRTHNPNGRPPYDWWVVPTRGYAGAHFATFPPELIIRPIVAGCPEGGVVLDPFVGSGTTLAVATGHGRDAVGIDLDERNADLARQRVGMWLEIEDHRVRTHNKESA